MSEPEDVEIEIDRTVAPPAASAPEKRMIIPLSNELEPMRLRDTEDLKSLVLVMVQGGCCPEAYLIKNTKKPDLSKMAVGILAGREVGWGPITSLQYVMIVRGMPAVWGKGAKALVQKSGKLTDYQLHWVDRATYGVYTSKEAEELQCKGYMTIAVAGPGNLSYTMAKPMPLPAHDLHVTQWSPNLMAVVVAKRRGVSTPFIGRFSVGDAQRARLWAHAKKATWIMYPQDMLEHKAAARVWDRGFADCLLGLAIREILEERGEVDDDDEAKVDIKFLGAAEPATVTEDPLVTERDTLLSGLGKCTSKAMLETWFQAAGGRIEWLVQQSKDGADHAVQVNNAYMAKLKSLEVAG